MISYPLCILHKNSPMQFVEVQTENCNWFCSSCLLKDIESKKQSNILDLLELKSDPYQLKTIFSERFQSFNEFFILLNNLQKSQERLLDHLKSMINVINNILQEIQNQIEKFKILTQEVKQVEDNLLNINQFQEILNCLLNPENKLIPDTKQLFELQLFSYIKNFLKPPDCGDELQKQMESFVEIQIQNQLSDQFDQLRNCMVMIEQENEKKKEIFDPQPKCVIW